MRIAKSKKNNSVWTINNFGTITNGANIEIRMEPNREPIPQNVMFDIFVYEIDENERITRKLLKDFVTFDHGRNLLREAFERNTKGEQDESGQIRRDNAAGD